MKPEQGVTLDEQEAIYESARHVGIPAEQITNFLATLKMCGVSLTRLRAHEQRGESGLPSEPSKYDLWDADGDMNAYMAPGSDYVESSAYEELRAFATDAVALNDTLRQELAAAKAIIAEVKLVRPVTLFTDLQERAESAESALRESRKDAERYRWLRDVNKHTHYGMNHIGGTTPEQRVLMIINNDPRHFECITLEVPLAHVKEGGEPIWCRKPTDAPDSEPEHFDYAANLDAAIDAQRREGEAK